jgi:proline iminopeptidase
VLIVAGDEDPRPPFAVVSLAEALPRAALVVMPGTGHLPWSDDTGALRAVLRQFVKRLAQA